MKIKFKYWLLPLIMIVMSVIVTSCFHKDDDPTYWLPDYPYGVTTRDVTSITLTTAVCSGGILWSGRAPITAKGFYWSASSNPSVVLGQTNDGGGTLSFSCKLTGLTANTQYSVWAYATNSYGSAYGTKKQFTTAPEVPVVNTSAVLYFTNTSAKIEGRVTSQGLTTISERGIFWSTRTDPEITGTKVQVGADTGKFSTHLMGLSPNTKYYIKAFAVNSVGISFGGEVSFTTNLVYALPGFTTSGVNRFTMISARSGGNFVYDGGSPITICGICWSTKLSPTTLDNSTSDFTVNGNFISSLDGLSTNTTYYVRAYAINGLGTAYGNELVFTTRTGTVSDIEGNVYYTQTIGSQIWMAENLRTKKLNNNIEIPLVTNNTAWGALKTPGYCWYNNSEGTYKNSYGAMYNWYSVNTGNLCPVGWHVPGDTDWTTLFTYLGGESKAAIKLKEAGTDNWIGTNNGTDESGFTALPGGFRFSLDGDFIRHNVIYTAKEYEYNDREGLWWSSTSAGSTFANAVLIGNKVDNVLRCSQPNGSGISVRCIKN